MNKKQITPGVSDSAPAKAPRPLRIIICDDDRDTVLTLMMVLREEGHEVRGVYRADDVVRGIKQFDPDAVLMDIAMPGLSGLQAAEQIRKRYGAKRPMLIAISGVFTKGSDRIMTQLVGFDHHLVKPYEPSDVLRLIAPLKYEQPEK